MKNDRKRERKFYPRKKRRKCIFCAEKRGADYKDVDFISRFVTDRGKVAPRRSTGCCAKHQRMITREIKKARQVALIPFTVD